MTMHKRFRQTAIVVALSSLFPVASASQEEVEELTNPNVADVAIKLPYINEINPFYRQYNGINHEGVNGNVDLDILRRSPEGGWLRIFGTNLGLSTQALRALRGHDRRARHRLEQRYAAQPAECCILKRRAAQFAAAGSHAQDRA
jgi:hypothetical protein